MAKPQGPTYNVALMRWLSAVIAAGLVCAASPASAVNGDPRPGPRAAEPASDDGYRLKWRWEHLDAFDYVVTGVFAGAFLAVQFGVDSGDEARWTGPVLFDDPVRDFINADTPAGRETADGLSDIFWYTPQAWAFTDLLVPLATDSGNLETSWQMTAITLQSASINAFLTRAGHRLIRRERPDWQPCSKDRNYSEGCAGGPFASFPSGHTSGAATGAGLVCAHHLSLPLYGGGIPDVGICALMSTVALGSGVSRMVADRHYATDVVAGYAIGFGSGFALPMLVHYDDGSLKERAEHAEEPKTPRERSKRAMRSRWTLAPMPHPEATGFSVYGWF